MTAVPRPPALANLAAPGDIAIVYCAESFMFPPGNRLRASVCLICDDMIGPRSAAIVGAAALAGEPCVCGGIVSDVFLIHAADLPLAPDALQAEIRRGLECNSSH